MVTEHKDCPIKRHQYLTLELQNLLTVELPATAKKCGWHTLDLPAIIYDAIYQDDARKYQTQPLTTRQLNLGIYLCHLIHRANSREMLNYMNACSICWRNGNKS